jgi:hypothetical protein
MPLFNRVTAAPNIAAADHDRSFHAQLAHRFYFTCNKLHDLRIDANIALARQRFAAQLQQNPLVHWLFRHTYSSCWFADPASPLPHPPFTTGAVVATTPTCLRTNAEARKAPHHYVFAGFRDRVLDHLPIVSLALRTNGCSTNTACL